MLSSIIYFKVREIQDNDVCINGYKFCRLMVLLPREVTCQILLDSECTKGIEVGKYYMSKQAFLTSNYIPSDKEKKYFTFRVSKPLVEITQQEFMGKDRIEVRVVAFFRKNYSKGLRLHGPEKTPFYSISVSSRSETKENFVYYALGFYDIAEKLNNLPDLCYVELYGVIAVPTAPWHTNAIIVESFSIRKEVK